MKKIKEVVTKVVDFLDFDICDPTPANEDFAVKSILSYEQKCKVKSKFLKN